MSKVIVIGGSGFLGSHVADYLSYVGHKVSIFDKNEPKYLKENQIFIKGDTLSEKHINKALKNHQVVYNFSGISEINQVKKNPVEGVKQNILSNTIILEACLKNKIKRFVFGSSIYVYSNSGDFYKSTKLACESIIESYNEVYGLEYTILRYGSLYGTRSDIKNGIYSFINQAIQNKKIIFNGRPDSMREYINVVDAAKISVDILSKKHANKNYILTGSQSIKIEDLIGMIKNILDDRSIKTIYKNDKNSHYHKTPYIYNPRKGEKISPNPSIDLGQGILEVIHEIKK